MQQPQGHQFQHLFNAGKMILLFSWSDTWLVSGKSRSALRFVMQFLPGSFSCVPVYQRTHRALTGRKSKQETSTFCQSRGEWRGPYLNEQQHLGYQEWFHLINHNYIESNVIIFSFICICVYVYLCFRVCMRMRWQFPLRMLHDSAYSTSHGAVGVKMAVHLETNFPISLNKQLKINLSNNWKFVVNNIQVHLCYICSFLHWFVFFFLLHFTFKFIN
jgi:hypothetical protein